VNGASSPQRNRQRDTPLGRLSMPPERLWPDGVRHHGSRFLLVLVLAVATTLVFPPDPAPEVGRYQVGMVADEAVIASLSFGIPKSLDELDRERAAAAQAVPPTVRFQDGAAGSMEEALSGFFASVAEAAEAPEPDRALGSVLTEVGLVLTPRQRELLKDPEQRRLLESTGFRAVRQILPRGVLGETGSADPSQSSRLLVLNGDEDGRYLSRDSVFTSGEFFRAAVDLLPPQAGTDLNELLRLSLIRFLEPSLLFDPTATERDRDAARRAVPTTRGRVLQGEAVVRANQQIGETELERLRAYEEALRAEGRLQGEGFQFIPFMAGVLLALLILGSFGVLLLLFRQDVYHNFRWVLLLGILVFVYAMAAGWVARHELPTELLPIPFVALAVAVLWDGRLALILAAVLAILTGVLPPFQTVHAWLPVFVGGSAAALSVRAVRRRAQWWMFIAIIAGAYVVAIGCLGILTGVEAPRIFRSMTWAAGTATGSAILAMGFLPVFEWFTRITTEQTLLEWADPNRPLLKRLSMEAPGTYAHTINVANLAEAAANGIGANGLLTRVGIYYHDVGKMLKPQYFIENQPAGRNPHDKLKPATSAAIVREHVTEGIRLAKEAGLPDVLLDFIPEHHGDQEISFFLARARQEAGEEEVDEREYRYPGPKPQSKETGIALLADSVESSTRALQEPTPERVWDLIETVVRGKIEAGQLDEAPLSLREIRIIKEQFLKVLAGVHHQRIDYPATRHLTDAPKKGASSGDGAERAEATGAPPAAPTGGSGDPPS
jgi:cyclic-di-AMP phosphodiesterase PgpH